MIDNAQQLMTWREFAKHVNSPENRYRRAEYITLTGDFTNVQFEGIRFCWCEFDCDLTGTVFRDCRFSGHRDIAARWADNLAKARFVKCRPPESWAESEALYAIFRRTPATGEIIGWKKVWLTLPSGDVYAPPTPRGLVKLLIKAKTPRCDAGTGKCRCAEATVLAITDMQGNPGKKAYSLRRHEFVYRVGRIVRPTNSFDLDPSCVCSSGIHFFMTKAEAKEYVC